MPPFERRAGRGRQRGRAQQADLGRAYQLARESAGLSQQVAADAVGISQASYSRIEAGTGNAGLPVLAAIAAVLGLDLRVDVFPGGAPLRDAGHIRVMARLRALLPPSYRWATEIPMPNVGDLRAIDAAIREPGIDAGFELETRLGDGQGTARRTLLKQRDAGLAAIILVLPDTRHNRSAVAAAAPTLRAAFPLDSRQVLAALRAGQTPAANGILFV